jgi:hypothetical protein
MLENILRKLGVGFLTKTLSKVFANIDNPIAKNAAKILSDVETEIAKGAITVEQMKEANRHIEQMAANETATLSEINASLRAEI